MDWITVIDLVLTRVLYPLLALLMSTLAGLIVTKIRDVRLQRVFLQVNDIVGMAVATIAQTFVDDLKKAGTWNAVTANEAADKALALTKSLLSEQAMKLLGTITNEIDEYLRSAIEEAVRMDKEVSEG